MEITSIFPVILIAAKNPENSFSKNNFLDSSLRLELPISNDVIGNEVMNLEFCGSNDL